MVKCPAYILRSAGMVEVNVISSGQLELPGDGDIQLNINLGGGGGGCHPLKGLES